MAARSKLTPQDHRRIIESAARRISGAEIAAELDGKLTRQAINKYLAKPEVAVAVESERNRLIHAERERKKQERSRAKLAREEAARGEAAEGTPLVRAKKPERRYASELGPNARERAGLSAMPDESWAAAEDRELQGCQPLDVGPVWAVRV